MKGISAKSNDDEECSSAYFYQTSLESENLDPRKEKSGMTLMFVTLIAFTLLVSGLCIMTYRVVEFRNRIHELESQLKEMKETTSEITLEQNEIQNIQEELTGKQEEVDKWMEKYKELEKEKLQLESQWKKENEDLHVKYQKQNEDLLLERQKVEELKRKSKEESKSAHLKYQKEVETGAKKLQELEERMKEKKLETKENEKALINAKDKQLDDEMISLMKSFMLLYWKDMKSLVILGDALAGVNKYFKVNFLRAMASLAEDEKQEDFILYHLYELRDNSTAVHQLMTKELITQDNRNYLFRMMVGAYYNCVENHISSNDRFEKFRKARRFDLEGFRLWCLAQDNREKCDPALRWYQDTTVTL